MVTHMQMYKLCTELMMMHGQEVVEAIKGLLLNYLLLNIHGNAVTHLHTSGSHVVIGS